MSHFIPENRNFDQVTRLPTDIKKAWLKVTLKKIESLMYNQTFLMDDQEEKERVVPCKYDYNAKIKSDGSLDKLKLIIVLK